MQQSKKQNSSRKVLSVLLLLAIVAGVFVGTAMAGKGNKGGGDDIILYNGNIVLRGNGGKGKGKGNGGSIVVANSPQSMDMMPYMDAWGGFGRRR